MNNRRRALMFGEESEGRLPAGYQEVEYIESTGTQYIDTGLEGKNGYTFETKVVFTDFPNSYSYLAGFGTTSANRIYFTRVQQNGLNDGWTYNGANKLDVTAATNTEYEYKSIMKNGEQKLYRNDILIGSGSTSGTASYGTIWLFSSNYNGASNGACACKMYNARFTYDGEVVGNFIPCFRKSDGVTGMYDLINNTFLANAGTGSFIRGPEIIYSAEFNNLKIYGDSIQNEVPSPTSPVDVKSIGSLVVSGQHSGQYEIKILINNGSTLTPYYLYVDEPLRKIGTTADVLDYKNHKVIRNIKEYIFEGTEADGVGSTSQSDKKRLYILTPGTARTGNNAVTILCSHYPADTPNRSYTCVLCCSGYDSIGRSCIYDDDYQTTAAFNAFALDLYNNNTPIKFYGILNTPIEETI